MKSRLGASLLVLAGLAASGRTRRSPRCPAWPSSRLPRRRPRSRPRRSRPLDVLSGGKAEIPGAGRGSSLADVVKLSKENRKDQPPKKSLGTITNENLLKGATPTPAAGKGTSKGGVRQDRVGQASRRARLRRLPRRAFPTSPATTRAGARPTGGRSCRQQRALVSNGEARVRDLETRSKQLENDFYAMSDGNRRDAVVKPAWDRAREELTKARAGARRRPEGSRRSLRRRPASRTPRPAGCVNPAGRSC